MALLCALIIGCNNAPDASCKYLSFQLEQSRDSLLAYKDSLELFHEFIYRNYGIVDIRKSDVHIEVLKSGLYLNSKRIGSDWPIDSFNTALLSQGELVRVTDEKRQSALRKFGIPLPDIYLYDTLGIRIYTKHNSNIATEIGIEYIAQNRDNAPKFSFSGSLAIDSVSFDRHSMNRDFVQIGFSQKSVLGKLAQLDVGETKIAVEFESNLGGSRLKSVNLSFKSDEIRPRNRHGWGDLELRSMRTLLENQLRPLINPQAVNFKGLLDCYCDWIKDNVSVTEMDNPSIELQEKLQLKAQECADRNRK